MKQFAYLKYFLGSFLTVVLALGASVTFFSFG